MALLLVYHGLESKKILNFAAKTSVHTNSVVFCLKKYEHQIF